MFTVMGIIHRTELKLVTASNGRKITSRNLNHSNMICTMVSWNVKYYIICSKWDKTSKKLLELEIPFFKITFQIN